MEIIEFKPQSRPVTKKVEKKEWRNQAQIAAYFQVSRTTVTRWVKDPVNPLPRHIKNGVKRIDLNEAEKWFEGIGGELNDERPTN